jgi:RNA polymerase sigma factor (sigma-70 family)
VKHIAEYDVDEILAQTGGRTGRHTRVFHGHKVRLCSHRYVVFRRSRVCVSCGVVGTRMILGLKPPHMNPHFNLYAEVEGRLVLMTVDHIIPLSRGGTSALANLQTMCQHCNTKKGNTMTQQSVSEGLPALYATHYEPLTKWLERRGCQEVDDLVQTAFIRLWQYKEQVRNVAAYLKNVAWQLWIDNMRSNARRPPPTSLTDEITEMLSYEMDHSALDVDQIREGIFRRVTPAEGAALRALYDSDYDLDHAADTLGITRRALTMRLRRIRQSEEKRLDSVLA